MLKSKFRPCTSIRPKIPEPVTYFPGENWLYSPLSVRNSTIEAFFPVGKFYYGKIIVIFPAWGGGGGGGYYYGGKLPSYSHYLGSTFTGTD